jgi:hypothetical protein
MVAIRIRRVALGTLAGGIFWVVWTRIIDNVILPSKYNFAIAHQTMLRQSRYPHFNVWWYLMLILLTYILTWVYVCVRTTLGPGPITALRVGLLIGFAMSFPFSFLLAGWMPISRVIAFWWMLMMWVGAIVATLISAWLYKEA